MAPRGPPVVVETDLSDVPAQGSLRLVKLPNILGVEAKPFDPDTYDTGALRRRAGRWAAALGDAGGERGCSCPTEWEAAVAARHDPAHAAACSPASMTAGAEMEIDERGFKRVRLRDQNCIR